MNPLATQGAPAVGRSAEYERIAALPRRAYSADQADALADLLTERLRQPDGKARLLPIQALALAEALRVGGLFGPIAAGAGKTLISLLLPIFLRSNRPLLVVPASLARKTVAERSAYAQAWQIPEFMRVVSYEKISVVSGKTLLEDYQPDAVIFDEAHRLKNAQAAVTRRVKRFLRDHPSVKVAAMSGTMTGRSLREYAHIAAWCLRHSPVPTSWADLEEWAAALDERVGDGRRRSPGVLLELCDDDERAMARAGESLRAARCAYRRRLTDTPGVIATSESAIGTGLEITTRDLDAPSACVDAIAALRASWELPDGEVFADAPSLWRHARTLALGWYYRWTEPAPRDWLDARRAWAAFCRETIAHSRGHYDSELEVAQACERGALPAHEHAAWVAVRDSFRPVTEPVWISDWAVERACSWARESGLVWCEHTAFGQRCAERSGIPYYGADALDRRTGRGIESHRKGSAFVSRASLSTGQNLQDRWHRNLFVCPPPNNESLEQALARTHRQGQDADTVEAEIWITCKESVDALDRILAQAEYARDSLLGAQRALLATWVRHDGQRRGACY